MELTITIDMGNAAFEDNGPEHEVARILRAYAQRLEDGAGFNRSLMDSNGNRVGAARVDEDTE